MHPRINKPWGWEVLVSFFLLADYGLFFGIKDWFFAFNCGILTGLLDAYILAGFVNKVVLLQNPCNGYWARGLLVRMPFLAVLVYLFIALCRVNILWCGIGLAAGFCLGVARDIQCRTIMHKVGYVSNT